MARCNDVSSHAVRSQMLGAVDSSKQPIERAQRTVAGLSGNLDHQAIGESQLRPLPKLIQRRRHRICILHRQVLMMKQHLDSGGNRLRLATVDGLENPGDFRKRDVRNPRAAGDKCISRSRLSFIVSDDQPDEDVRVNGAHDGV